MNSKKKATRGLPHKPSQTVQHAAVGASVQDILARSTGGRFPAPQGNAQVVKFFEMPSETFHEMLNRVTDLRVTFSQLPARTKGMFGNDPYQLLRWVEDPQNRKQGLKMGLIRPTPEEAQEIAHEAAKARRIEQVDFIKEASKGVQQTPQTPPEGG